MTTSLCQYYLQLQPQPFAYPRISVKKFMKHQSFEKLQMLYQ